MVDTNQIANAISIFELFFKEVKSSSKESADVEKAEYGLSKVKFLWDVLKKYEKKPQNRLLKKIDAGFVSVTRGVEFFTDYETNKRFYELSNFIPELKSYIKW